MKLKFLITFISLLTLVSCASSNYQLPQFDNQDNENIKKLTTNYNEDKARPKSCSVLYLKEEKHLLGGLISIPKINANTINYRDVARSNSDLPILDLFENSYSSDNIKSDTSDIIVIQGIPFKRIIRNDKNGNDIYSANYKDNHLILVKLYKKLTSDSADYIVYNQTMLQNTNVLKTIAFNCGHFSTYKNESTSLLEKTLLN